MNGVYLFALCLFFYSCGSVSSDFVSVGSGGGFAGTATVYKVTPKGEVFKGGGIGEIKFTQRGKIKKGQAKAIIAKVAEQARTTPPFSHPGNLYYFIESTENGAEKKITWGDADHTVPENVKRVYDEVDARVSTIKYKPIK